jgi:hypothetical protein
MTDITDLSTGKEYTPVAGLNELSPDEFTLPTLKLTQAQSTSPDSIKHLGEWFRRDTAEYLKAPALLILGIAKSRVLFPAEYGGEKSEPLCKSDNATFPRAEFIGKVPDGFETTIPDTCADCLLSQWGDDGDPPACTMSENWAALTETGDPVVVRLSRSASKASAQLKNMARAAALKRKPLYICLDSRMEINNRKMQFYIPVISSAGLPPDNLQEMAAQFAGLNLAERAAEQDEAPEVKPERNSQTDESDGPGGFDIPF